MQLNQANLAALYRGYRTVFAEALQGAPVQWPALAMRAPSSAASEIYHWLASLPGMKKLVGEIVVKNVGANNWTITNDEWEDTVAVKQADIERDTYGIYNPLMASLGLASAQHKDELVGDLLNNGFSALDYTGKAFFAATKKHNPDDKKSATFTNLATAVLSADAYGAGKAALRGMKNGEGRPMRLGRSLKLVVPPVLEDTALEITKAERNAAGATNIQRGTAEVEVLPDLTSDTAWFLLETGLPIKPLIVQVEKEVELASLTSMDSDHVFKNHEFLYQAYGRYNAGYGFSQLAYGSTGAG